MENRLDVAPSFDGHGKHKETAKRSTAITSNVKEESKLKTRVCTAASRLEIARILPCLVCWKSLIRAVPSKCVTGRSKQF